MSLISVIVTTYNWPDALALCLESLYCQEDKNFEIIIADDGSTLINRAQAQTYCLKSPVSIKYIHHEDQGFRAAAIRNKAVAQSKGDYLLFIDGDCILRPNFITRHRQLAAAGHFIPGNRILLSQAFTQEVLTQHIPLYLKPLPYFIFLRLQNKINRISALLRLPLGPVRNLQPNKWQKAMTCNLAIWKNDFMRMNGFDELFEGWGFEDSDLVIRMIHSGIKRKEGRFAVSVLHLWHPQNDKGKQELNYRLLMERLVQPDFIFAKKGISQYLSNF
ncbi:GT2 family glycosyltransferase [Candidatus Methylobacter favarea]|uniref:GT2 family glycosyltransferase n=1 Tax=Candidatus Methylobacter favarea TaxID=2707345 RepID=A0A8S0X9H2_9GAMM|nr:glycosyltransferase family 2 protein [Candidatus Methylobacter favarea]CAA9892276.1 GT2 family glycosyltransferase [Candidatus Methylobacter favarea]